MQLSFLVVKASLVSDGHLLSKAYIVHQVTLNALVD